MKYRKKPIIIEAEQWFPNKIVDGVIAIVHRTHTGEVVSSGYGVMHTLESGKFKVIPGDWIITGVKGEKYPCKDDIFKMTYEPV